MEKYVTKFGKLYHHDLEIEVRAEDESDAVRRAVLTERFQNQFRGKLPLRITVERVYDDPAELAHVLAERYSEYGQ